MYHEDNSLSPQPADFYLGIPGGDLTYLGSVEDGHPAQVNPWEEFQTLTDTEFTEVSFRAKVANLVDSETWAHDHESSTDTPWAYCWHLGTVYIYRHGVQMATLMSNLCKRQPDGSGGLAFRPRRPVAFPAFTVSAS